MDEITVIIHTFNGEREIGECIDSARLLTENILVIDMESTDGTQTAVKNRGINILTFPHSDYVEPARKFAIEKAEGRWVLVLDSDERLTGELAGEIKKTVKDNRFSHFRIPRKNIFGRKQWLRYGGWWPDAQIRLINKKYFRDWPKDIHSTPVIDGKSGLLQSPILHYFHGDLEQMLEKTAVFEDIESDLLFKADRPVTILTFFRKFTAELFRRLIRDRGFLDGKIGIIEGIYQAFSKTVTYLFLYEKKNSRVL